MNHIVDINKMMLLILTLAALSFGQVICPACSTTGKKSNVYPSGVMSCTDLYCGSGFYDTLGTFHASSPCNSCWRNYKCSNGHEFTREEKSR
jgi:hypothetical protein